MSYYDEEEQPKKGRGRPRKYAITPEELERKKKLKLEAVRHRRDIGTRWKSLEYDDRQAEKRKEFHPRPLKNGGWQCGNQRIPDCDELTAILFSAKHTLDRDALEYYFWAFADIVWNADPDEPMFIKNKWSWKIIRSCCREKYLGIGGSASSGKSYVLAGWAIFSFMIDPANTLVLVTSTDLKGARSRIYGAIRRLLSAVPDPPCKIKDAIGIIAYDNGAEVFETSGIHIVTADKSKSSSAVGKLIGRKSPRLILIADEHGEMGMNVTSAATGNLAKNPHFQMISLSNPASRFDPFGCFVEPEKGWDAVDVIVDTDWDTKLGGYYMRLNSEESPNIDETIHPEYPVGVYCPGLVTREMIEADLNMPGQDVEEVRKTRNFMRFHSAVFFDGDETETVYSESEIVRAGATQTAKIHNATVIAGCDPSYSDNGDNTVIVFCEEGYDQYTQHCVQIREVVYINEDVTDKVTPRSVQIANKIKDACEKRGVLPQNLGIDASSGSGTGICDMLALQWGTNMFLRVNFAGAASKKRISQRSDILGCERYKNRATELFMQGKQYLAGRQFYGIPTIIAKQMCQRICLEPTKGPRGLMYQIEPKKAYKARVGSSPDELDAFLVCVETALCRKLFTATDPVPQRQNLNVQAYLQTRRTASSFAADKMGFVANLS